MNAWLPRRETHDAVAASGFQPLAGRNYRALKEKFITAS